MKTFACILMTVLLVSSGCKKKPNDSGNNSTGDVKTTIEQQVMTLVNTHNLPFEKVEAILFAEITSANKDALVEDLKNASQILYAPPNSTSADLMTLNVVEAQQQGWIDFSSILDNMDKILDAGKTVYTIKWSDSESVMFQTLAVSGNADTLIFDSMISYPLLDIEFSDTF